MFLLFFLIKQQSKHHILYFFSVEEEDAYSSSRMVNHSAPSRDAKAGGSKSFSLSLICFCPSWKCLCARLG